MQRAYCADDLCAEYAPCPVHPNKPVASRWFAVLDFEATCDEKRGAIVPEIIEFPVVLLDGTGKPFPGNEFRRFVRPTSRLTAFCTELTSIEQKDVDSAPELPEVLAALEGWLRAKQLLTENGALQGGVFVTCGDWDIQVMLRAQCKRLNRPIPRFMWSWINIKHVFQAHYKLPHSMGMPGMLDHCSIELTGHHHLGIDDCRNIGKILAHLLADGCVLPAYTNQIPSREQQLGQTEKLTKAMNECEVDSSVLAAVEALEPSSLVRLARTKTDEAGGNKQRGCGLTVSELMSSLTKDQPLDAKARKMLTSVLTLKVKAAVDREDQCQ